MEEEDPGDIVIKGTYTTRTGAEVPVEIHTNQHGLIYQTWRAERARRGEGVRELKEGEPYYFQKQPQAPDIPDSQTRTLLEVFAEEKMKELAQIQGRLEELRAALKHASHADEIRAEILNLEKKLLGDP